MTGSKTGGAMKNLGITLSIGFSLLACQTTEQPTSSIGVTEVEVAETGQSLRIRGYDAEGKEIAAIDLELGRIWLVLDEREVDGCRLKINVLGEEAVHEHEGDVPVRLPDVPLKPNINAFLADARVAEALARWRIAVVPGPIDTERLESDRPPQGAAERQYYGCSYNWPGSCGIGSCSAGDDHDEEGQYWYCSIEGEVEAGCCDSLMTAFYRKCGGAAYDCGTPGPNGCAGCWSVGYSSQCATFSGSYHSCNCYAWDGASNWCVGGVSGPGFSVLN
jgi:hypothetical protein